jgi:hypothetical protein
MDRFLFWPPIFSTRVESVGGEFAGAKAELKLFQDVQTEQQQGIDQRVTEMESKVRMLLRRMGIEDQGMEIGDE